MLNSFRCTALLVICGSFVLFGCGGKGQSQDPVETGQNQMSRINCIAVLPASSVAKDQAVPIYVPEEKEFRRGVQVMNEILSQELGGKNKIRFVGVDEISSLDFSGGESPLVLAKMVGKLMSCNAVLESSVKRFDERVGGRYSVESPASVAFALRMIYLDNDSVLWSAKFDESQKSVMENILDWNKANTRGFVWVTAEELMREGVKAKFADSPYFKPADEQN